MYYKRKIKPTLFKLKNPKAPELNGSTNKILKYCGEILQRKASRFI